MFFSLGKVAPTAEVNERDFCTITMAHTIRGVTNPAVNVDEGDG